MPFRPTPGDKLTIDETVYRVAEHPSALGMAYGQEGRQGIVFQLFADNGRPAALKLFKSRFRAPALVAQAQQIAPYTAIAGLEVCARTVLSPIRYADLIRQHTDLSYAVVMPWVSGPTWLDVILSRQTLTSTQSLSLARSLALLLATMEERRLAHCDLSAPNLLLPGLLAPPAQPSVALVDVEQLYGPGLDRPEALPGGSAGYAHRTAPAGLWSPVADRFAGAVLLAEVLGWCDARVRAASSEESYFDPEDVQRPGQRVDVLHAQITQRWGARVAHLFQRAWESETLADCPTFGEWLVALPDTVTDDAPAPTGVPTGSASTQPDTVRTLLELAAMLRGQGNRDGAITTYRQALGMLAPSDGTRYEIQLLIADVERGATVALEPTSASAPREIPTMPPDQDRPVRRLVRWPVVLVAMLIVMLIGGGVALFQGQVAAQSATAATAAAQAGYEQATNTQQAYQVAIVATANVRSTATTTAQLAQSVQAQQTQSAVSIQQAQTATAQIATAQTATVQIATAQAEAQQVQTATAQILAEQSTQTALAIATSASAKANRATAQARTAIAKAQIAQTAAAVNQANQQMTVVAGATSQAMAEATSQAVLASETAAAESVATSQAAEAQVQATKEAFLASLNGEWSGPNSGGGRVRFWVDRGLIIDFSITLEDHCGPLGIGPTLKDGRYVYGSISGNQFHYQVKWDNEDVTIKIDGSFESDKAQGTYYLKYSTPSNCYNIDTTFNWSASKVK
ncbi:MAG: hypothetical protein WCK70_05770 [Chloroflexales bacterium]